MAAFDLNVQAPAQVRIPQGINAGAQNLMQFMRIQQDNRNKKDTLKLQTRKADDTKEFQDGQLNLDQQRTENQQDNFLTNQTLARDKFTFDQGADQRKLDGNIALNQAIYGARTGAMDDLSGNFNVNQINRDMYQATSEYQNKSPEERLAFDTLVDEKFKGEAWKHAGMQKTREALLKRYAGTGMSREQIETKVQSDLQGFWAEKQQMPAGVLKAMMGGGNGTGTNKSDYSKRDNPVDQFKALQEYGTSVGAADSEPWFDWLGGKDDITKNRLSTEAGAISAKLGIDTGDFIRGFDTLRDGKELKGNMSFGEIFGDTKSEKGKLAYAKFLAVAQGSASERGNGRNSQGGNNSAAAMQMFSQMNQPRGQGTTVSQRGEAMMEMLGAIVAKKKAEGRGSEEVGTEEKELIKAIEKETVSPENTNAETVPTTMPVGEDTPKLDFLLGNEPSALKDGLEAAGEGANNLMSILGNMQDERAKQTKESFKETGLLKQLFDNATHVPRKAITAASDRLSSLMSNSGDSDLSDKESKIAALQEAFDRLPEQAKTTKRVMQLQNEMANL